MTNNNIIVIIKDDIFSKNKFFNSNKKEDIMQDAFYTWVEQIGNKIYHRFRDNEGQSHLEIVEDYPLELFIKGKTTDSVDIFGNSLSRIEFSNIKEARNFIEEYKDLMPIYGQTNFVYQFIAKKYPEKINFNLKSIKIFAIDIETKFDANEFPNPTLAKHEICAITVKPFGKDKFYTWGLLPYQKINKNDEYWLCSSEKEMLISFVNFMQKEEPDILTGWNIVSFDIPYLINRINNQLGENFVQKLSPIHRYTSRVIEQYEVQENEYSYRIAGLNILDYLDLYKKFAKGGRENYKLNTIVKFENLEDEKIDYSEYKDLMDFYLNNHQKYIEYNIKDVILIEKLDNKLNYIKNAIALAYLGKIRYFDIFSQIRLWDNVIYIKLLKKNIQIPPKEKKVFQNFEGAFVKEPIPKKYNWVISLDLTSLYPSIIMALNMSPETLVEERDKTNLNLVSQIIDNQLDLSFLKEKNVCMAANGAKFSKDKLGFMAEIVEEIFLERITEKNSMINLEKELEKIKLEMNKRGLKYDH